MALHVYRCITRGWKRLQQSLPKTVG